MVISATKKLTNLLGILSLLVGIAVLAQEDELLTNGGLEEPYRTLDGEPLREVAHGWLPWHSEGAGTPRWRDRQPSYHTTREEERIWEGEAAQLIASYYETHDAGLYQVVEEGITMGMVLEFSAHARTWSNATENRSQSEYDGDVFVQVGIDPSGGRDPASEAIVWSLLTEHYDEYQRHAVEAQAEADAVTVFLRSLVLRPQAYSQVHWDEAELLVLQDAPLNPARRRGLQPVSSKALATPDG